MCRPARSSPAEDPTPGKGVDSRGVGVGVGELMSGKWWVGEGLDVVKEASFPPWRLSPGP